MVLCITFGAPNAAQWVAAWGTVAAIFAALFVPLISRNIERADRRADRRDYSELFVGGLLVPMGLLRADVTRARSAVPALQQAGALTANRIKQLEFVRLRISTSLEAAIPQFAAMDPAVVGRVHGIISFAQSYNGMVDSALERARIDINGFEAMRPDWMSKVVAAIDQLEDKLVKVIGLPGDAAKSAAKAAAEPTSSPSL